MNMLLAFLATSETSIKNVVKCYGCVFFKVKKWLSVYSNIFP